MSEAGLQKKLAEAQALLERLRAIPPQHASLQTLAAYSYAVSLLSDVAGGAVWCDAIMRYASHLLESPEGDRRQNLEHAKRAYRAVLDAPAAKGDHVICETALAGFANSLVSDPYRTGSDVSEAIEQQARLIERARQRGDLAPLVVLLGQAARAHATRPDGDQDANLVRAIELQEEAIRLVADSDDPKLGVLRGRARHNVAAYYTQSRSGVTPQQLDRAVRALQAALEDRPAAEDPVGRMRTLRALAELYPRWGGAESLAHGQALAEDARTEADAIEAGDGRAARRTTGWAEFERQQSALSEDIDDVYHMPPADRVNWLRQVIQNHDRALAAIPREMMPRRWAHWMGGKARLLGHFQTPGLWQHLPESYACFAEALQAAGDGDPGLRLELLMKWGEVAHGVGDFEAAYHTYGPAAELRAQRFRAIAEPEHQWAELQRTRGVGLFAAYAAARIGKTDEAARFAEMERGRSLADLFSAAEALQSAPGERRAAILATLQCIAEVEQSLREIAKLDPDYEVTHMNRRLADAFGVSPSTLTARRVDARKDEPNPRAAERPGLHDELRQARESLRKLLHSETGGGLDAEAIRSIAGKTDHALVYVMATVHGGMAVGVLPRRAEALPLEQLSSGVTRGLAYGSDDRPGFISRDVSEDAALDSTLAAASGVLTQCLAPLTTWLRANKVARAALIPLGSTGLLPLHVGLGDDVAFTYAPSARAFGVAARRGGGRNGSTALIVGDPRREDEPSLRFAVAEARALAAHFGDQAATALLHEAATADAVRAKAAGAHYVHFACHGRFRPSEPVASQLLMAGNEELTLADVLAKRLDVSAARLVNLCACQSGNTESERAPDEAFGFPAAFMLSGVPAVVSTLWPVRDDAAMLFAVRFYDYLLKDGLSPAEAVARARGWLREATPRSIREVLAGLRSQLKPEDSEARTAVSNLGRALIGAGADARPFARSSHWAGFILCGA
jgi:CHAT domain-containing protein